jgi:uncharacterized protein
MSSDRRIDCRPLLMPLLLFFFLSSTAHSQSSLPTIPLYIRQKEVRVEVAKSPEEQSRGLMGRTSLGKDEGMLFLYDREVHHGFWMKNTLIPLSIAFVDSEGRIITILDMEPLTLESHLPPRPFLYALEMNKGWFSQNGIKAGDVMRFSK